VLLAAIATAAFLCTFGGGLFAYRLRDKLHLILGFSAGAVLGVAFFDLLPEALDFGASAAQGAGHILACSALGFLVYLVMDRMLLFHRAGSAVHGSDGGAARSFLGAGVLCLHSFLDGITIGLAFQTSRAIGTIVAIAVLTHDFSDGINTMNVVIKNRGTRGTAFRWLAADALAPVAGVIATSWFRLPPSTFGRVLAVFAGFFLYIGASDLIPESYHGHPKLMTTAMTLAGAALLYVAVSLVSSI